MDKDFDTWNILKKEIDRREREVFFHTREIWWCSLGVNIGAEIDGKNYNFERPVIILKVYSRETLLVLPITSKQKDDKFHYKIDTGNKRVWVKLTQSRVISSKRLHRKIDVLNNTAFNLLKSHWKRSV